MAFSTFVLATLASIAAAGGSGGGMMSQQDWTTGKNSETAWGSQPPAVPNKSTWNSEVPPPPVKTTWPSYPPESNSHYTPPPAVPTTYPPPPEIVPPPPDVSTSVSTTTTTIVNVPPPSLSTTTTTLTPSVPPPAILTTTVPITVTLVSTIIKTSINNLVSTQVSVVPANTITVTTLSVVTTTNIPPPVLTTTTSITTASVTTPFCEFCTLGANGVELVYPYIKTIVTRGVETHDVYTTINGNATTYSTSTIIADTSCTDDLLSTWTYEQDGQTVVLTSPTTYVALQTFIHGELKPTPGIFGCGDLVSSSLNLGPGSTSDLIHRIIPTASFDTIFAFPSQINAYLDSIPTVVAQLSGVPAQSCDSGTVSAAPAPVPSETVTGTSYQPGLTISRQAGLAGNAPDVFQQVLTRSSSTASNSSSSAAATTT